MYPRSANKLLNSLTAREFRRIRPLLHVVHLSHDNALPNCGRSRVYFPTAGGCSIRRAMGDGRTIEIASVGGEGLVGLGVTAGDVKRDVYRQVGDGAAQYMAMDDVQREMGHKSEFQQVIDRYSRAFCDSMIRLVGCSQRHSLQERCCRWLATSEDVIGRREIPVSVDYLAGALGGTVQQMTAVLKTLSNLKILHYDDSVVVVLDKRALQRMSCSCYRSIKESFERVLNSSNQKRHASLEPAPPITKIVQIRPVVICTRCRMTAKAQHETILDCIRAIDQEVKLGMQRFSRLRSVRQMLLREHLRSVSAFLDNPRLRREN